MMIMPPEVSGSHSDADDDSSLLGSCTVATGKQSPTFRRSYFRHLRDSTDTRNGRDIHIQLQTRQSVHERRH